ncbi:TPA: hypothetical protein DIC38_00950 [Candidatus Nomurabacteria bacterium]|nr:MAG: hypothetical protein O210_OD1C00001G0539 [Parcubacteria bacterium RAAC4_OD1_1]HCY26238.1 hypothetical protein [Candidatus Nomurabacteria bacterium]
MKSFTSNSQKIGKIGEDLACRFLMKHGFFVLERNYTRKWGEIDIIAIKDNKIYFVEVKSKQFSFTPTVQARPGQWGFETGRPEENMHIWKMQRLRRIVETYLISNRVGNREWQFDLLVVYIDIHKKLGRVKVVENIIL